MRAASVLLIVAAGCGGDVITRWVTVPGAPSAIAALDFDSAGAPIVVGGTFPQVASLERLQRDGTWQTATGVPPGGPYARIFRRGTTYHAVLGAAIYHLDDATSFTWSAVPLPANVQQILGVDGTGAVYSTSGAGVMRWAPGDADWTVLAGADSAGSRESVVLADGTMYASTGGKGLWRVTPTGTTVAIDCATFGCKAILSSLTVDAKENLYFLDCPFSADPARRVYELRAGASTPTAVAPLPPTYLYCRSLQALPDGTLILAAATDNTIQAAAALFRLSPGDSSFSQITGDDPTNEVYVTDPTFHYVAKDDSTIYGYGDGAAQSGIIHSP